MITIKDVARAADVSVSTVSKALNGTGSINAETVKKIKKTAKNLGYTPNKFAGALSRKKLKIGVIIPKNPIEVMYYIEKGLLDGIAENSEYGAEFIIKKYDLYTKNGYDKTFEELLKNTDGIIASGIEKIEDKLSIIGKKPLVMLVSGTKSENAKNISKVSVNGFVVGKIAAQFIFLNGGRKTAIISGNPSTELHNENIAGFKSEASVCGMTVEAVSYCQDKIETAYKKTIELLQTYPDITGIFTTSYVAPGICDALKFLKKEKEVCVVGLDLYKETKEALNDGSLNAVIFQNQVSQAKTAVKAILEMTANRHFKKTHTIRPELVLKSNLECYAELLTDDYNL